MRTIAHGKSVAGKLTIFLPKLSDLAAARREFIRGPQRKCAGDRNEKVEYRREAAFCAAARIVRRRHDGQSQTSAQRRIGSGFADQACYSHGKPTDL
jgi:hypothetical protein